MWSWLSQRPTTRESPETRATTLVLSVGVVQILPIIGWPVKDRRSTTRVFVNCRGAAVSPRTSFVSLFGPSPMHLLCFHRHFFGHCRRPRRRLPWVSVSVKVRAKLVKEPTRSTCAANRLHSVVSSSSPSSYTEDKTSFMIQ